MPQNILFVDVFVSVDTNCLLYNYAFAQCNLQNSYWWLQSLVTSRILVFIYLKFIHDRNVIILYTYWWIKSQLSLQIMLIVNATFILWWLYNKLFWLGDLNPSLMRSSMLRVVSFFYVSFLDSFYMYQYSYLFYT